MNFEKKIKKIIIFAPSQFVANVVHAVKGRLVETENKRIVLKKCN